MPRPLAEVWTGFADTACGSYSPLYDRIARTVAASDAVLDLVEEAPPQAHMPTVLLAAVHDRLLAGADHPLAAVYAGTSDADPGPLFVEFCLEHRTELLELLATRHTNTNEVGRSAAIGLALTATADRLGRPLGLVDVGCSAGLNLFCDRYRLDYGSEGATGPPDSEVRIDCAVVGGHPPVAPQLPPIGARIGIDRDPVDLTDDDDLRWQLACVWPDTGRLPRTRLALEVARRDPPRLVAGDAVDCVEGVLDSLDEGLVPVVVTTWALAYLAVDRRVEFRRRLATSSARRPVAWVSGEHPGTVDLFDGVVAPSDHNGTVASILGLAVFSEGRTDPTVLGFVHPHGGWVDWRAA